MNQVVLNLCANAVRAMRGRNGTLTVAVSGRDRVTGDPLPATSRHVLELRVRDNGHGMDSHTLERIFEPYFTTRDVGEGTGLSLSIVQIADLASRHIEQRIVRGGLPARVAIGVASLPGDASVEISLTAVVKARKGDGQT